MTHLSIVKHTHIYNILVLVLVVALGFSLYGNTTNTADAPKRPEPAENFAMSPSMNCEVQTSSHNANAEMRFTLSKLDTALPTYQNGHKAGFDRLYRLFESSKTLIVGRIGLVGGSTYIITIDKHTGTFAYTASNNLGTVYAGAAMGACW